MLVIIFLTLLPRGLSVHSVMNPHGFGCGAWNTHFQAIAYPLSQLFAGKPLLTAAPPLYGYYAEFLLPLFKLTGLSVFKFCLVQAALQILRRQACSQWRCALSGIESQVSSAWLHCSTLFGGTWGVGRLPFDPYFQYGRHASFSGPLDSNLPLGGEAGEPRWMGDDWCLWRACACLESGKRDRGNRATFITLCAEIIAQYSRPAFFKNKNRAVSLLIAGCAAFTTAAVFWLAMHIQADWKIPVHQTGKIQRLFYEQGFMMMPMPPVNSSMVGGCGNLSSGPQLGIRRTCQMKAKCFWPAGFLSERPG